MAAARMQHVLLQKCHERFLDQHESPVLHLAAEVYISMVLCRETLSMQRDLGRRCVVVLDRLYHTVAFFVPAGWATRCHAGATSALANDQPPFRGTRDGVAGGRREGA